MGGPFILRTDRLEQGYGAAPRGLVGVRKIFDREQLPIPLDHAHADRVHIRIQNICAVAGRVHELRVNEFLVWTLRDVFREPGEMKADLLDAGGEAGLTLEGVLRRVVFSHHAGVTPGGDCQRLVQVQRGQALGASSLIYGSNELAFRPCRPRFSKSWSG